jgi:hypothetical protein
MQWFQQSRYEIYRSTEIGKYQDFDVCFLGGVKTKAMEDISERYRGKICLDYQPVM